jgi:hypothetical protein
MSLSYGWEKLHTAVHSLAGSANQSERLVNAAAYSLLNINPKNDLPEEMREDFETLIRELTAVEAKGDEGKLRATINSFSEVELNHSIEKIIGLYDSICRHRKPN